MNYELLLIVYAIVSLSLTFIAYVLFKKGHPMKRTILVLTMLLQLAYFAYRIKYTIPTNSIVNKSFGMLMLLAEGVGFFQSLVSFLLFWKPITVHDKQVENFDNVPTVDVYIATYNEPIAVLTPTIIGAKNAKYPESKKKIYVLDDGNRQEVKELASSLGVEYIARTENIHAKAGNLNNAFSQTHGDIIVTQDADMIMKEDFFIYTIPYFDDLKMGYVQTPQTFYNLDIFQKNLFKRREAANEQDFFMRYMQPARNEWGAAMYIGSNCLFRREALESINGFSTGVITEDMVTGMLIQNEGWKTTYINRELATGLSAETVEDYVKQKKRWGRGTVQVAKKYGIFNKKGLSMMQRIIYFDGVIYWLTSFSRMFFLLSPFLFVFLSIYIIQANLVHLLLVWLPFYVSQLIQFKIISNGKISIFYSQIMEYVMAPYLAKELISELFSLKNSKSKFEVTEKGLNTMYRYFDGKTATFFSVLAIAYVFAIIIHSIQLFQHKQFPGLSLFWMFYNLVLLIFVVMSCREKSKLDIIHKYNSKAVLISNNTEQVIEVKLDILGIDNLIVYMKPIDVRALAGSFKLNINSHQINVDGIADIRNESKKLMSGKLEISDTKTQEILISQFFSQDFAIEV